jgi:hypothetical protein
MSLPEAVIELGPKEFTARLSFVVISQVKTSWWSSFPFTLSAQSFAQKRGNCINEDAKSG